MKKLLLLSALSIFACSSELFAQDYMKMRKKQLRIEHQKKLKLIDSLSQELSLSNKKSQNLQSDLNNSSNDLILTSDSLKNSNLEINQLEVKLLASKNELSLLVLEVDSLVRQNSKLSSELILLKSDFVNLQITNTNITSENQEHKSNLELLNSNISLLNQELTKEKEISQKLRDLSTIRDFSDGTFNDDELAFITNYFKIKLKSNAYNEEDRESKAFIDSIDIEVSLEGEAGYVPAFYFKRNYNTSLAGDLDKDGTHEIIFNVEETGGGPGVWFNYYCLKIFNGNRYEMFQIEFPCPCKESEDCGETSGWIVDVSGDILTISSSCFLEDDANCCPSSEATSKYKFDGKPTLQMKDLL